MFRFLLFFLFCSFSIYGEFYEIDNFAPLQEEAEKADSTALFVFDVDDTLITFKDRILRSEAKSLRESIVSSYPLFVEDTKKYYRSIVLRDCEWIIIDPEALNLFKKIHQTCSVIALTATRAEGIGVIPWLPEWRFQQLKNLDFSFQSPAPYKTKFFSEFSPTPHPYFYRNLIFSGAHNKGEVLAAFIETLPTKPQKVIFVDDRRDRVDSVLEAMEKREIACAGYQFLGARNLDNRVPLCIANLQFKALLKELRWYPEEAIFKKVLLPCGYLLPL